jgi:hypothetical protein
MRKQKTADYKTENNLMVILNTSTEEIMLYHSFQIKREDKRNSTLFRTLRERIPELQKETRGLYTNNYDVFT